jgi:hypothetical protein
MKTWFVISTRLPRRSWADALAAVSVGFGDGGPSKFLLGAVAPIVTPNLGRARARVKHYAKDREEYGRAISPDRLGKLGFIFAVKPSAKVLTIA